MNSIIFPSSLVARLPFHKSITHCEFQPRRFSNGSDKDNVHWISSLSFSNLSNSGYSLCTHWASVSAAVTSNEGPVSVINFEDFVEKDWSFLDPDELNSNKEYNQKIGRIISAGGIEETSRVLISVGSEGFVDKLVDTSPCSLLLVVHDSLFLLAIIKEKYDKVKCWQGELIYVPEKWAPLDVVFLYFLPALPFQLDQVFESLAKRCSPGARVVISHPQGREVLEKQRKQYQDIVISDLPDKVTLRKVAFDHSFEVAEFVDEPGFYLAILRFSDARDWERSL